MRCGDDCEVTIVDVKDGGMLQSLCSLESGDLVCRVTNWLETAFQAKHGACTEDHRHAATYEFQLLNTETQVSCH